jgi:hypothetical protein
MPTAILALCLLAADLWRRRRAFQRRMDAIDRFMEWGMYEKIDRCRSFQRRSHEL